MTKRWQFDPQTLIASYIAAYIAAGGNPENCRLTYERGWFRFHDSITRYRRHQIERMRERLLSLVNEQG